MELFASGSFGTCGAPVGWVYALWSPWEAGGARSRYRMWVIFALTERESFL